MQTVVVPGAGVTTVVRCGGLGSLLLTDTQPASHIGTSRRTAIFGMAFRVASSMVDSRQGAQVRDTASIGSRRGRLPSFMRLRIYSDLNS